MYPYRASAPESAELFFFYNSLPFPDALGIFRFQLFMRFSEKYIYRYAIELPC